MNSRRTRRKYAKMMSDLSDHDLMACIYMLCSELIHRSGDTITLSEVLTAIWNIGKLVDNSKSESEDKEC